MKASKLNQEALDCTVNQMQIQRFYLPTSYIISTVASWADNDLQPDTEIGQEVVRVYKQCLRFVALSTQKTKARDALVQKHHGP